MNSNTWGRYIVMDKHIIFFLSVLIVSSTLNAKTYYKECDFNHDGKINGSADWKKGLVDKETSKREVKCRVRKCAEDRKRLEKNRK